MDLEEEGYTQIVMIPFPAQGHQNPMMRLACRLASFGGIRITFFVNNWFMESAMASREEALEHLIKVEGISEGQIQQVDMKGNTQAVAKMIEKSAELEKPIDRAVTKIHTQEQGGVRCIISDAIMDWPQDLANRLGIPRVGLWTSSVPTLIIFASLEKLVERGLLPLQGSFTEAEIPVEGIPGLGKLHAKDLPYSFIDADREGLESRCAKARRMKECSYILLNTFEDLDKEAIRGLQSIIGYSKCFPVGPLLPNPQDGRMVLPAMKFGNLEEDRKCLTWLDDQEALSVVYISFGSLANLSVMQIEELALGLEASRVAFLWVIRPSLVDGLNESHVFKAFIDRANMLSTGFLVDWAPQLEVLAHASIGLFLSHCGWNSTMEAIWNGVPLLTFPCFAEQNTNARYIVSEWKIGAPLRVFPGDMVQRDEVKNAISSAMKDHDIRRRMDIMRNAARRADKQDEYLKSVVYSL